MNTPHKKAYDFLKSHKYAVLSTSAKNGQPWGSAIYYAVDKDLCFYFFTHAESQKYKNMQEQPHVALTVADDDTQTTVQVAGKVAPIEMGPEHDEAYRMLVVVHPPGQYKWVPPVSKLHDGPMLVLKLTPKHLQLSTFHPSQSEPEIHKVV